MGVTVRQTTNRQEEIKGRAVTFPRTEGFSIVRESVHLEGRKQTHTKAHQKFQNSDKTEKRLPVSQEKKKNKNQRCIQ